MKKIIILVLALASVFTMIGQTKFGYDINVASGSNAATGRLSMNLAQLQFMIERPGGGTELYYGEITQKYTTSTAMSVIYANSCSNFIQTVIEYQGKSSNACINVAWIDIVDTKDTKTRIRMLNGTVLYTSVSYPVISNMFSACLSGGGGGGGATNLTVIGTGSVSLQSSTGTDITITGEGINPVALSSSQLKLVNTGDTNPSDDLVMGTAFSGEVSGLYNTLTIGNNTVTSAKIVNGTIQLADLAFVPIVTEVDGDIGNEWNTGFTSDGSLGNLNIIDGGGTFSIPILNIAPIQNISVTTGISLTPGPGGAITLGNTGDLSAVNEGVLGVGAGIGTTAVINSNTSGAVGVTISAPNAGLAISETTSSNGGTIVLQPANSLAAIEALSGSGFPVQTIADTYVLRTISAGTGITIGNGDGLAGNPTVTNTGDTNSSDDVTFTTNHAGDVSGVYNALSVDKIKAVPVSATAPTTGQVLKYDGTNWKPDTDAGGTTYTAGTGISIVGPVISNTGDTNAADDVLTSTAHAGDVSGVYNALSVDKIKGQPVSATAPTNSQVLIYNGTTWVPTADWYHNVMWEGVPVVQEENLNFVSSADVDFNVVDDSGIFATEVTVDIPTGAIDYSEIQVASASRLIGNPAGTTSAVTEIPLGAGLTFTAGSLVNSGDTNAADDLTTATTFAGDVSGAYNAISVNKIKAVGISATAPTTNQVLKYDGTNWAPGTDIGSVSGTTGRIATFTSGTAIGNSLIYQDANWQSLDFTAGSDKNLILTQGGTAPSGANIGRSNIGFCKNCFTSTGMLANTDENVAVGYYNFTALKGGDYNVAIGSLALNAVTSGTGNMAIGYQALQSDTSGNSNMAVGGSALRFLKNGQQNTAIGTGAGEQVTSGNYNVLLGATVGRYLTTATGNIGIGYQSLNSVYDAAVGYTTGGYNTAIGYNSLRRLSDASDVVAIGNGTGWYTSTSAASGAVGIGSNAGFYFNKPYTAIGYGALQGTSSVSATGDNNTAIGANALNKMTNGSQNTAIGQLAGSNCTSASRNVFIGLAPGQNYGGVDCVFLGSYAGGNVSTGSNIICIGQGAMQGAASSNSTSSVAIGSYALQNVTNATGNMAMGHDAFKNTTTGSGNTGIGYGAGFKNTVGSYATYIGFQSGYNFEASAGNGNIGIGYQTLYGSTTPGTSTGYDNVGIGNTALRSLTTGTLNMSIGRASLYNITTGQGNTAIGDGTLYNALSGSSYNVFIGAFAGNIAQNFSNAVGIGISAGNGHASPGSCMFLGYQAGYNGTATNALYIDQNTGTVSNHTPLIGGKFANGWVGVNTLPENLDASLNITSAGSTSSTNAMKIKNSAASVIMNILDNGCAGFGVLASSTSIIKAKGLGTSTTSWGLNVYDNTSSTATLSVRDDRKVGIRTESPSAVLSVAGDVSINGTGSTSSTVALKIRDVSGSIPVADFFDNGSLNIRNSTFDPSASFVIGSSGGMDGGFLGPRITTGVRDAFASPTEGLQWYNTTTKRMEYKDNTAGFKTNATVESDITGTFSTITATTHVMGAGQLGVKYDATSNNITVTAGASINEGYIYTVRCINNGTNTVTFSASSGYTIEVDGDNSVAATSFVAGGVTGTGLQAPYKIYNVRRWGTIIFIK